MSRLERVAFFLLVIVAGARPLVSETYESALVPTGESSFLPTGLGPGLTLGFGSIVILATVLAAAGRARGGPAPCRSTGLLPGGVLVAIGMGVSLLVASNRRVAMNASSDWLITAGTAVLLVQLLRRPWQVRLLLCVLVASAAAFAFQCLMQRFVEFPETIADYEANKARFWAAQGVPPDDSRVRLYEHRLYAREAGGFFPHANVAAGFLLLGATAAMAMAVLKLRGGGTLPQPLPEREGGFRLPRPLPEREGVSLPQPLPEMEGGEAVGERPFRLLFGLFTAIVAVALFACIAVTGSRGAALAGLLVTAAAGGWRLLVSPSVRRWEARLALAWAAAIGIAAAVVLSARIASPWSSMGFRWDYWRNTASLLGEYFWTGVGAQNFGKYYLQVKPITSPEEVRDPHNFLLAAFGQWGILGALGVLVMAAGASYRLMRPGTAPGHLNVAVTAEPSGRRPIAWLLAGMAGLVLIRLASIIGMPGAGGEILSYDPVSRSRMLFGVQISYLFYATATPTAIWLLAAVAMTLEGNRFAFWSDRPIHPDTAFVLVAGGLAFLLHALIDVTLFYPGTASTFFVLLAVAMAIRHQGAEGTAAPPACACGRRAAVAAVILPIVWGAHLAWLCRPAIEVQRHLAAARRLRLVETEVDRTASPALREYRKATAADPLDPTAPGEAAEWLFRAAVGRPSDDVSQGLRDLLDEAATLIGVAETRDPREIGVYRTKASIHLFRAERFNRLLDGRIGVGAAVNAVELYPASPQDRVLLAEALASQSRLEQADMAVGLIDQAIESYRRAFDLNAARPGDNELRKWSAAVLRRLERRVSDLMTTRLELTPPPSSAPATATAPARATEPANTDTRPDFPSSGSNRSADNLDGS